MLTPSLYIIFDQRWDELPGLHCLVADVSSLMADEDAQNEALSLLSPQRREKATAFTHARGRALSIGVGLLLDALLREVGLKECDQSYAENEHGKPMLTLHPEVHFNLSHSGSLAAAAIGPQPLGLDVQRITRYRPELVRRVFSAADRQRLGACSSEIERERLFAQLWSRAEAYAKLTGDGLQWPFPEPPEDVAFYEFTPGDDYVGCLCVRRTQESH